MLTALTEEAQILEGFRAGADDYISKPFNPRELGARVDALLMRSAPPRQSTLRRMVTVFSPKAGVGKTTLAVNLAVALATQTTRSIAVVDGNLSFGNANLMLDLPADRSILDLVPFSGEMDQAAVEQALARHSSGVGILPRPARAEYAERVSESALREVLDLLTRLVDVTVVDTETSYASRTLSFLDRGDVIVLVGTLELAALRNLREFLGIADRLGYPRERMLLVLNRSQPNAGLRVEDVRGVVGMEIGVEVPDGGLEVVRHGNLGRPIVLTAPRSEVSRAILKLAQDVAFRVGAA
jgi:pilus assembly protein CpaE